MRTGDLILSFTPPVILLAIAAILVWRKTLQQFPIFFGYVLYAAIAGILRTTAAHNAVLYFRLYWWTEAVYGAVALAVLGEVFHRIFVLAYAAYKWFRTILPLTILLILAISIRQMIYHPLGRGISVVVNAVYWFDLGIHLIQGVVLLLLLALTTVFPVSWRRYEFGILAGFGVNASITMLAYLFRFEWGSRYELFFRYGPPVGYLLATLVWLHAFLRPPESLPKPPIGQEEMREIVRRYRELLERIEKALGLRRRTICSPT